MTPTAHFDRRVFRCLAQALELKRKVRAKMLRGLRQRGSTPKDPKVLKEFRKRDSFGSGSLTYSQFKRVVARLCALPQPRPGDCFLIWFLFSSPTAGAISTLKCLCVEMSVLQCSSFEPQLWICPVSRVLRGPQPNGSAQLAQTTPRPHFLLRRAPSFGAPSEASMRLTATELFVVVV